ncbi:hypothetical protein HPP92_004780 [Vanilla planifolia]|uniref:Lysine-specific demethylase JMJ16 n=1 Tax=Vanilla planifolia TaxID=51239 RepID=A0A835RS59_VANPL|nr:hypothetical protein HPP92_004780 [Vanilla planifolia]
MVPQNSNAMMVTECMMTQFMDETDGLPSVPPGFYSLKSFDLQRVQGGSLASTLGNEPVETKMDDEGGTIGVINLRKSLRRRRWVNYCQHNSSSGEEGSGSELSDQDSPLIQSPPKGVIRGCVECENCQKIIARWRPEGSCRPILDEAPVFYPSEEEFKDTLKYIASVRPRAEPYGICRIVPPPAWKPPCPLKEKKLWEGSTFTTRIQSVDKLQNRHSLKNDSRNHGIMKRKRRRLKTSMASRQNNVNVSDINDTGSCSQMFGFAQGPNFSLESFQKYADFFKEQYFCNVANSNSRTEKWEPSIESIEGEYWRIVEQPTEEIEVLYGADLETAVFGSGFSKAPSCTPNSDSVECYAKSGWNLNNVPRLPGSVLAFESGDISGVLVPWLYVGMCFSSFCWHVEDHHLYSVNYLHWGAPKIWYGIPGRDALNFETVMKKHLVDLFEEQPNLLHKLVTQFSPSILKSESVPVYRCIQHPGEFVITFPRAYHSGFNCGFNCAEAVNIAPVDWLPHGQHAVELYREQMRKITISHDKLLLETARETVKALWNILFLKENTSENRIWKDASGPDGVLAKSLKARVELERVRRDHLSSSQLKKMDSAFDADCERECIVCHYDLHLSATSCPCSPDKFTCLEHAKHLCSCDWKTKLFLIRYEISELNILIDAVGGKLSAVHKWGVQDLRLSLSAYVSKEKISDSRFSNQGCSDINKGIDKDGRCREFPLSSRDNTSMRDAKSVQQSSSRAISKASSREMAVDSASGVTNSNSTCQQRKSIAPSENKESGKPDTTSLKIRHDQNLQKMNSCSSSDARSFQEFICTKSSQNTGTIGYCNSCSPSEPEVNLQSKLISVMSSVTTNLPVEDALLLKVSNKLEQITPPEFGKGNPGTGEAVGAVNTSDKERIYTSQKKQVPVPPRACTTVILQQRDEKRDSEDSVYCLNQQPILQLKEKGEGKTSQKCSSNIQTESLVVLVAQGTSPKHSIDLSTARQTFSFSETKEVSECSTKTFGNDQKQHCHGISISSNVNETGKVDGLDSSDKQTDAAESAATCSSFPLGTFDRQNHMQKGPRLAKVVRRISCNVELLECGVVLSGKLWSTCKAIFPKGYKTRVRYWNIMDPSQMCYYVSEILDAGLIGPLFMVKLEQRPSEVFFHVCVTKCWDMVRERVNNEIRRMHNLGRVNLPSLQPPGSVDGYEMFGLTSQTIIQAIESIDQGRVCSEYWRSRPIVSNSSHSRDQRQASNIVGNNGPLQSPLTCSESKLAALLKKASSEELHALCTILSIDQPEARNELLRLTKEENRSRLGFKL